MSLDEMELRQLRAEVARLSAELDRWRSTGAAAADEIESCWKAHCDESGAGPVNLVRRLRGKPDVYGSAGYRQTARRIEGFTE